MQSRSELFENFFSKNQKKYLEILSKFLSFAKNDF